MAKFGRGLCPAVTSQTNDDDDVCNTSTHYNSLVASAKSPPNQAQRKVSIVGLVRNEPIGEEHTQETL